MNTITIMVRRSSAHLQQRLEQKDAPFKKLPFCYRWSDCGCAGKMLTVTPNCFADRFSREELIKALAPLLTNFIIEDMKLHLLHDLVRFFYFYFDKEERRKILTLACRGFESEILYRCFDFYRSTIESYLQKYLCGSSVHLNIEGFYNFRMPGFRRELWQVLDDAVDLHLAEKEHCEFIRLLKYFLNLQQPGVELVHLFIDLQGRFKVMNRRFKRIDSGEWREFGATDFGDLSNYEDIFVSMLVSLAPRRIIVHRDVIACYPQAVKSLRSIFEKRLIFCKNCAYCRRGAIRLITGDRNRCPGTT